MGDHNQKEAVLVLENGSVYRGKAGGMKGTTVGEICFNTGMTGYQEVFTDPSYFGQVMVTTNAHIGNYGTRSEEDESEQVQISGLICKNFNNGYSRALADSALQDYFENNKIVCIHSIDTRAIVKEIRDGGAMNCIISSETTDIDKLKAKLAKAPSMKGLELSSKVCTKEAYTMGDDSSDIRIAVMDFGTKKNILRCLVERGAYVKVYPAKTPFADLQSFNPDGYFLSNGPGDPASMDYAIETVKTIIDSGKPTFGICLGHQLLALGAGVNTFKMHHGHRGINHPVKNLLTGKCEITSQNHGFGVIPEEVHANEQIEITHVNLNDESIEGIKIVGKPASSVQYHPEANPGPHDSRYLFDDFVSLVKQCKQN